MRAREEPNWQQEERQDQEEKGRKQNARENTKANGESLRNLVFKWPDL